MVAQYYHSMPDEEEALKALERVGLRERAKHLPSQLSGGEQQRVCIARALINYPMLILADEPTGNLDETNEQRVMDIFRQLHRDGSSIIVVTHDPEIADEAERTVVLEHGKLTRNTKNVRAGHRGDEEKTENGVGENTAPGDGRDGPDNSKRESEGE
jgi:putative ABC transport system ATP-binding protein